MVKKLQILFLILLSQANVLFSQINDEITEKKNQFYVRTIINQINVGYLHSIGPAVSFSFEAGWQFNYIANFHYTGSPFPFKLIYKNLDYSGLSLRFSPVFKISELWTISPLIGYQDLYAKKIIYDPGNFAGVSDAEYAEYSQRISEIIFQILFYKQDPDIPIQFYFGPGIRFQHLYNAYSIEGTVDHKVPSDRKENHTITYFPTIIVGIKFLFAWF
jgi:hypothetical protein